MVSHREMEIWVDEKSEAELNLDLMALLVQNLFRFRNLMIKWFLLHVKAFPFIRQSPSSLINLEALTLFKRRSMEGRVFLDRNWSSLCFTCRCHFIYCFLIHGKYNVTKVSVPYFCLNQQMSAVNCIAFVKVLNRYWEIAVIWIFYYWFLSI